MKLDPARLVAARIDAEPTLSGIQSEPASRASPDEPLRRPDGYYRAIFRHGGKPFWYHALRYWFGITVAAHELKLPKSLVKRLVNHQVGTDVTEDYATRWTLEQLASPHNGSRTASTARLRTEEHRSRRALGASGRDLTTHGPGPPSTSAGAFTERGVRPASGARRHASTARCPRF